jgi:hypothetical protein
VDKSYQEWELLILARPHWTCSWKNLSKSTATVKGHLNQQRMFVRSTQPKKEHECTMASASNLDYGIKTQCIYASVVDAGQIYTDQTGILPVISSRGNVSIMYMNTMGMQ